MIETATSVNIAIFKTESELEKEIEKEILEIIKKFYIKHNLNNKLVVTTTLTIEEE